MVIDLSPIHSQVLPFINVDCLVDFNEAYLENTDVLKLDNVKVVGTIRQNSSLLDEIDVKVEGKMLLLDSISQEEVVYPFSCQINKILKENDKKDENTLDIMDILWENIVLEIPLKFTKVEDLSKFHGDGWKLISEEERAYQNNPFSELLKEFGEEWIIC